MGVLLAWVLSPSRHGVWVGFTCPQLKVWALEPIGLVHPPIATMIGSGRSTTHTPPPPCEKEGESLAWDQHLGGPRWPDWTTGQQPWSLPAGFSMIWSNQLPCYLGQYVLRFFSVYSWMHLNQCTHYRLRALWGISKRSVSVNLHHGPVTEVSFFSLYRYQMFYETADEWWSQDARVCPSLKPLLSAKISWLLLWYLWAQRWGRVSTVLQ